MAKTLTIASLYMPLLIVPHPTAPIRGAPKWMPRLRHTNEHASRQSPRWRCPCPEAMPPADPKLSICRPPGGLHHWQGWPEYDAVFTMQALGKATNQITPPQACQLQRNTGRFESRVRWPPKERKEPRACHIIHRSYPLERTSEIASQESHSHTQTPPVSQWKARLVWVPLLHPYIHQEPSMPSEQRLPREGRK